MAKKKEKNGLIPILIGGGLILLMSKGNSSSSGDGGSPGTGTGTGTGSGTASGAGGIISKYYTADDVRRSSTATDEGITQQFTTPFTTLQKRDINDFIRIVLDPLTAKLGHKLDIGSWWRSAALNAKVGGEPDSLHLKGVAIDFKFYKNGIVNNGDVIRAMYEIQSPFTELILYGSKTAPKSLHLAFDYQRPVEKEILFKKPEGGYETLSKEFIYNNFIAA